MDAAVCYKCVIHLHACRVRYKNAYARIFSIRTIATQFKGHLSGVSNRSVKVLLGIPWPRRL